MTETYSGFIAIIGPTNAGKSTLLNQIMGRKVSIVSHKVQTTRTNFRAIKMVGNKQLIFVDTPGVFRPARRLDRAMVSAAMDATGDADAILLVVDAQKGITDTVRSLIEKVKEHKNLFVALNKVDAVAKPDLLPLTAQIMELANPREIFMISALKNDGVQQMLESLAAVMPSGPYLFEAKDASDVPDNLYLAELTREKIYRYIHQELPYHINVVTEKVDVDDEGVLDIYQKIAVQNEAHKKIVIGRGGAQLKRIGTAARHDIQDQWGVNARLHLFVRVEPDWENKAENYEEQGLEFKK
ncbi:MAG TPA: GTPase Era [Candidatus Enterousia avicola]|uniref:GTPase Era n=1 Tax=Candidatus Enterousia avicola TaxID=2840787 RepID=A0A9D1MSD0_9PROT|nr:GTPase Era [Candidatus Enterousia avicola]